MQATIKLEALRFTETMAHVIRGDDELLIWSSDNTPLQKMRKVNVSKDRNMTETQLVLDVVSLRYPNSQVSINIPGSFPDPTAKLCIALQHRDDNGVKRTVMSFTSNWHNFYRAALMRGGSKITGTLILEGLDAIDPEITKASLKFEMVLASDTNGPARFSSTWMKQIGDAVNIEATRNALVADYEDTYFRDIFAQYDDVMYFVVTPPAGKNSDKMFFEMDNRELMKFHRPVWNVIGNEKMRFADWWLLKAMRQPENVDENLWSKLSPFLNDLCTIARRTAGLSGADALGLESMLRDGQRPQHTLIVRACEALGYALMEAATFCRYAADTRKSYTHPGNMRSVETPSNAIAAGVRDTGDCEDLDRLAGAIFMLMQRRPTTRAALDKINPANRIILTLSDHYACMHTFTTVRGTNLPDEGAKLTSGQNLAMGDREEHRDAILTNYYSQMTPPYAPPRFVANQLSLKTHVLNTLYKRYPTAMRYWDMFSSKHSESAKAMMDAAPEYDNYPHWMLLAHVVQAYVQTRQDARLEDPETLGSSAGVSDYPMGTEYQMYDIYNGNYEELQKMLNESGHADLLGIYWPVLFAMAAAVVEGGLSDDRIDLSISPLARDQVGRLGTDATLQMDSKISDLQRQEILNDKNRHLTVKWDDLRAEDMGRLAAWLFRAMYVNNLYFVLEMYKEKRIPEQLVLGLTDIDTDPFRNQYMRQRAQMQPPRKRRRIDIFGGDDDESISEEEEEELAGFIVSDDEEEEENTPEDQQEGSILERLMRRYELSPQDYRKVVRQEGYTNRQRDYGSYYIQDADNPDERTSLSENFEEKTSNDFAQVRSSLATVGDGLRVANSNVLESFKQMYPSEADKVQSWMDAGKGVFATRDFSKGTLVTAYEGAIINVANMSRDSVPVEIKSHLKSVGGTGYAVAGNFDQDGNRVQPKAGHSAGAFINTINMFDVRSKIRGDTMPGANVTITFIQNTLDASDDPCDYLGVIVATRDIREGDELLAEYSLTNTQQGQTGDMSAQQLKDYIVKHRVDCQSEETERTDRDASIELNVGHFVSEKDTETVISSDYSPMPGRNTASYAILTRLWNDARERYEKDTSTTSDAPIWGEVFATVTELLRYFGNNFESVAHLVTKGRKFEETGRVPDRIQHLMDAYPHLFWMSAVSYLGHASDIIIRLFDFYDAAKDTYVALRLRENIRIVRRQLGDDRFFRNLATWIEFYAFRDKDIDETSHRAFYATTASWKLNVASSLQVIMFLKQLMSYDEIWYKGMDWTAEAVNIVARATSGVFALGASPLLNVDDVNLKTRLAPDDNEGGENEMPRMDMVMSASIGEDSIAKEAVIKELTQHAPAMGHFYTLLQSRVNFEEVAQGIGFGAQGEWTQLVELLVLYDRSKSAFMSTMVQKGRDYDVHGAIKPLSYWRPHLSTGKSDDMTTFLRQVFSDRWTLDYYTFVFLQDTPLAAHFVRMEELGRLALMAVDQDPFDSDEGYNSDNQTSESSDSGRGITQAAIELIKELLQEVQKNRQTIHRLAQTSNLSAVDPRQNATYLRIAANIREDHETSPYDVMGRAFIKRYVKERLSHEKAIVIMYSAHNNPMLNALRRYDNSRFWRMIIAARYGKMRFRTLRMVMKEDEKMNKRRRWGAALLWIESYEHHRFLVASHYKGYVREWPLEKMRYEDSVHVHLQHNVYSVAEILEQPEFEQYRYATISGHSARAYVFAELARQDQLYYAQVEYSHDRKQVEILHFKSSADHAMHCSTKGYRQWLGANENYQAQKGRLYSGSYGGHYRHMRPDSMLIGTEVDETLPITGHMLSLLMPLHTLNAQYQKHGQFISKNFGRDSVSRRSAPEALLDYTRDLAKNMLKGSSSDSDTEAHSKWLADALPIMVVESTGRQEPLIHCDEHYFGMSEETTYRAMCKFTKSILESYVRQVIGALSEGVDAIETYNRQEAVLSTELEQRDFEGFKRDVRLSEFYRHVGHSVSPTLKHIHDRFHHMIWVDPVRKRFGCNMRYAIEANSSIPIPSDENMTRAYQGAEKMADTTMPIAFEKFTDNYFLETMRDTLSTGNQNKSTTKGIFRAGLGGVEIDMSNSDGVFAKIDMEAVKRDGLLSAELVPLPEDFAGREQTVTIAVRTNDRQMYHISTLIKERIPSATCERERLCPAPETNSILKIVIPFKCT